MHIQISYPIVDIRPFLEEDPHQIGVPVWDYQDDTFGEFVRHFGHIRFANSYVEHLKTTPFSKARGAIKLYEFNNYNFLRESKDKGPIQAPYPHRRLFVRLRRKADQPFSCEARFDFGVKIRPARPSQFDIPDLVNAEESIHSLIKRFLNFPVAVGTIEGTKRFREPVVGEMGSSISNLYLYASSRRNQWKQLKEYWVKSLMPIVVLQIYSTREAAQAFLQRIDPAKIVRESTNDQFHLLQFGFKAFGHSIPTWVLVRSDPSREARQLEQQLAWNIIRGHAEYQTASYLSRLAAGNRLTFTPRSEASQRFQYFIDQLLTNLSPREDAPPSENALFQAIARDHYQSISVEDCLKLLQNLSHIRKNILRKLGNFSLSKNPREGAPVERLADGKEQRPLFGIEQQYIDQAAPYVRQKNLQDFEDYIRYLIGQSKLEESLEILMAYLTLSNIAGDPLNTVTLHLQKYRSEHNAFSQGIITRDSYNVTQAAISKAILEFFSQIPV